MNPTWLYVALVYFLAVWIARRWRVDLPWKIAIFFYALVLLFMFEPMTGRYVNLPVDFLQRLPPWSYISHAKSSLNGEMNDIPQQIVPWAHQVRESWRSGHAPLWNHLSGSGYPLLANGQSSALSPLRILSLPLSLGHAFTAEAAWKLLIALTFMWLLCRRRGYSELASAVGAISFGFCTFLIVWLHFPLVTAAAFIPAVLLQIDLLVERRTYGRFVFAVVLWTAMLFSGHPETASHAFFFAFLYLAWILLVERPLAPRDALRLTGTLLSALAVSGLLAAPFLFPLAEGIKRSKRYQELRVQPNVIGYYSDVPSQKLILQPHFFGAVPDEPAWGPARAESITGFAGFLGVAAWFAVALLVITQRRWRSREAFFVVATLIVLGIILAWPGVSTAFHAVFKLAANARLRLLLCLCLAALASAAVDAIQRDRSHEVLAGLYAASVILLSMMTRTEFPSDWARDTALLAILPSIIVIAVATVAAASRSARALALMILVPVIIGELWKVDRRWNPVVPDELMYPPTPLIEKLQSLVRAEPAAKPVRITGLGPVLFPNAQAVFGLEDIRAHDPMANGRYLGVLRVSGGLDTAEYFAKWDTLDSRLLDYLNVKYIATLPGTEPEDTQRYRIVYDGRDGRILENRDVLPRFFAAPNVVLEFNRSRFVQLVGAHRDWATTALLRRLPVENDQMRTDLLAPRPASASKASLEMISASPTEYVMRVSAPRYTMVVSSIPLWRGWEVERNGESFEPLETNGAFLGFVVRPGVTTVRVRYSSLSFNGGVLLSTLTLIGLAVPAVRRRQSRSRESARSEEAMTTLPPRTAALPD